MGPTHPEGVVRRSRSDAENSTSAPTARMPKVSSFGCVQARPPRAPDSLLLTSAQPGLEPPALVGPRVARPPPHGLGRRTWCAETAAPARSHSAMPALPATGCSLSPAFLRARQYQPRQAAVASLVCQLAESRDRRYRTRTRRRSANKVGKFRSWIQKI